MKYGKKGTQFLQEIISSLCGLVYIVDFETLECTWDNGRFYDILGYENDEIIRNILEITELYIHPDDKELVRSRINYFNKQENIEWSGVYRIRHKNGHWVWLFSRIKVLSRDMEGIPKLLLGEILEVSEDLLSLNRTTIQMNERLKYGHEHLIGRLTNRELEIIYHISRGLSYKEIAEALFISPETVNKHRKNILQKLQLKNIAALSSFASDYGLV